MTQTEFTAGPWKLHTGGAAVADQNGGLICSCYQVSKRTLFEEKANARLIAAAPELLEALEKLYSEHLAMGNDPRDEWWMKEAEAAIAKARGES